MAFTDRDDLNYLGILYEIGGYQTPLLTAIGGLNAGSTSSAFTFPVAQPYSLTGASQPAITETASVSTNTATTVARGQDFNTAQIFQYTVEVSYAKQTTAGELGGLSQLGNQPVQDEYEFQKMAQFRQMAIDLDFSFIQGAYQLGDAVGTAAKMRGLEIAIETNTVAAGAAVLTKAMISELLIEMVGNGAIMENVVILCNAFNRTKITDLYAYAPEDRSVGGVSINQIWTDFGMLGVMYEPNMPTDEVYLVEMSVLRPIFVPVKGQTVLFEDLPALAASRKGQWYGQIGLDYGPEEYHGSITGTATTA